MNTRRLGKRLGVYAFAAAALIGAAGAAAYYGGLRINTTESMPVGLWIVAAGAVIERGQVVSVCPVPGTVMAMAKERGYVPSGVCPGHYEPLIKPVAAIAGDVVTVTTEGVAVNGVVVPNTRQALADGAGRPMPRITPGEYPVASGTVWILSSYNAASFDSRYFGPLPVTNIEGVARPLFTKGAL